MNQTTLKQLQAKLPQLKIESQVDLAPLTTVKIGGKAEFFCQVNQRDDLVAVVNAARELGLNLTVLGWGSNTLIADRGVRGLVVRNLSSGLNVIETNTDLTNRWRRIQLDISTRWQNMQQQTRFTTQNNNPLVLVEIDSGLPIGAAIAQLQAQSIVGLEPFTRIPGTIAGAIVNNIHGADVFFGSLVDEVLVIDQGGQTLWIPHQDLRFDYDYSRFHQTDEVIIAARLILQKGDVRQAQTASVAWAKAKAHQPQRSLGCVFQNLSPSQQTKLKLTTPSAGYVIDHLLKLKNARVGDAQVSPEHAAFIENIGHATAADYLALIKKIMRQAQDQLDIKLKPEIFFLGFTQAELSGIIN